MRFGTWNDRSLYRSGSLITVAREFIHSIGVCRMRRFLAILRNFFRSSLSCTFSCHPSPPTILPSSLTSFCLEYTNHSHADNANTVRHEASRHFRNKNKEYLKAKIDELEINGKINNIRDLYRGISDFKKGYQPRTNIVKDEKGNLVTDSRSSVARWRNHFSQLLNVHGPDDVRQTEMHTAEPQVPKPNVFEGEKAVKKLKRHKSPGIDQIPSEFIKAGVRYVTLRSINLLILFGVSRNCLRSGRSQISVPIYKKVIKQIVVVIEAYHFC